MSDNGDDLDCKTNKRLRFDKETRIRLSEKLHKAIASQASLECPEDIDLAVNGLIFLMEIYTAEACKNEPENQQRRKERIESIANHLDGIIEQLRMLDYDAYMHVISRIWSEMPDPKENLTLHQLRDRISNYVLIRPGAFPSISRGIRKAAKTLPKIHRNFNHVETLKDFSLVSPSLELGLALRLRSIFLENGLSFPVTNSGLTADCLRAMLSLRGLQIDRVDYWLSSARDFNPFKSQKNQSQKTHEM